MDKMKIRIKLPDGSEFEAEGPASFVLEERKRFMEMFCSDNPACRAEPASPSVRPISGPSHAEEPDSHFEPQPESAEITVSGAVSESAVVPPADKTSHQANKTVNNNINHIDNVNYRQEEKLPFPPQNTIWHEITKRGKNGDLVLCYKPVTLQAADAVLILLAAEYKVNGTRSLPALAVSKMIKYSGYHHARLDRLLAGHIRSGLIRYEGTKRNRLYSITEKGFQEAALLASGIFPEDFNSLAKSSRDF